LEGFISALLNEKIKIINIKESESNKANAEDKFNRVDIFVEKIEEKIEIALNLLKMGISIEVVCNATGLSKQQIEKLEAS